MSRDTGRTGSWGTSAGAGAQSVSRGAARVVLRGGMGPDRYRKVFRRRMRRAEPWNPRLRHGAWGIFACIDSRRTRFNSGAIRFRQHTESTKRFERVSIWMQIG